ncbi:MAG: hypothetical protein VYA67_16075 [Actinomycetota bacterium]|uniref:Antitoxin VbhA domain-containing protein n=1 Tax=Mycobacterium lentiflavum TaxID=141349 RepID=A0ABY3USK8_MYCLN|nr:hypothetical protein [Mycobacterium lentiflavum]MEE3065443.1 hypothetical protein [Actinomycetota bacterium]ULP42485.1 hypothetical protein MJO58_00170 [Mycobacterium lentiflavum]
MATMPPQQPRRAASQHEVRDEDVLDTGYTQLAPEFNSKEANVERRSSRVVRDTWLSESALRDELAIAEADYAAGNTVSGEELRRRYGLT